MLGHALGDHDVSAVSMFSSRNVLCSICMCSRVLTIGVLLSVHFVRQRCRDAVRIFTVFLHDALHYIGLPKHCFYEFLLFT